MKVRCDWWTGTNNTNMWHEKHEHVEATMDFQWTSNEHMEATMEVHGLFHGLSKLVKQEVQKVQGYKNQQFGDHLRCALINERTKHLYNVSPVLSDEDGRGARDAQVPRG